MGIEEEVQTMGIKNVFNKTIVNFPQFGKEIIKVL
jgi:hypothetical protein